MGGKKGGKARASVLSPQERTVIAHRAAQKRWGGSAENTKSLRADVSDETEDRPAEVLDETELGAAHGDTSMDTLPLAEFGSPDWPLRIGELEIPCYVLSDGRRNPVMLPK